MSTKHDYTLVIAGVGGVGKSAITIQFLHNRFLDEYDPTIEESYTKQVMIDNIPSHLQIIDTAGQEEYAALRDQTLTNGDCYVLIYSITSRNSFDEIKKLRVRVLRMRNAEQTGYPLVICGNKCDLEQHREVSKDEGQKLADNYVIGKQGTVIFHETSAKNRFNIDETFFDAVRAIRIFRGQVKTRKTKKCLIL